MESFYTLFSDDPGEVQTVLTPILGNLKVTPLDSRYRAWIRARVSSRLAVFAVDASDSRGCIEPSCEYFGLSLPLAGHFRVTEADGKINLGQDIYLARPDRAYAPELRSGCRTLGVNIFLAPLQTDLRKLTGSDVPGIPEIGNRIDTSGAVGLMLARAIIRLWSETNQAHADPGSSIAIAELEDELISRFVTTTDTLADCSRRKEQVTDARAMARVQEFLDSHLTDAVSRADLADVAGVSIRTLSRSFFKRHGTGPMGFLKARRMYAAYRDLLAAEAPSTRVTKVAVRYGFSHFGKFAMEYKKMFGESPSVTLNRRAENDRISHR